MMMERSSGRENNGASRLTNASEMKEAHTPARSVRTRRSRSAGTRCRDVEGQQPGSEAQVVTRKSSRGSGNAAATAGKQKDLIRASSSRKSSKQKSSAAEKGMANRKEGEPGQKGMAASSGLNTRTTPSDESPQENAAHYVVEDSSGSGSKDRVREVRKGSKCKRRTGQTRHGVESSSETEFEGAGGNEGNVEVNRSTYMQESRVPASTSQKVSKTNLKGRLSKRTSSRSRVKSRSRKPSQPSSESVDSPTESEVETRAIIENGAHTGPDDSAQNDEETTNTSLKLQKKQKSSNHKAARGTSQGRSKKMLRALPASDVTDIGESTVEADNRCDSEGGSTNADARLREGPNVEPVHRKASTVQRGKKRKISRPDLDHARELSLDRRGPDNTIIAQSAISDLQKDLALVEDLRREAEALLAVRRRFRDEVVVLQKEQDELLGLLRRPLVHAPPKPSPVTSSTIQPLPDLLQSPLLGRMGGKENTSGTEGGEKDSGDLLRQLLLEGLSSNEEDDESDGEVEATIESLLSGCTSLMSGGDGENV